MRNLTLLFIFLFALIFACRKDEIIDTKPSAKLEFSKDSILFDTVFTNSGSTNRVLKVFNRNKNSVILSSINLKGGNSSAFKININGVSSSTLSDIKIRGKDSIYVFVKAFINPDNKNSPFLVEDELNFTLNGKSKKIPLIAYGQNAVYFKDTYFTTNRTFTKDKPYLFFGEAVIGNLSTITIEHGARLYFHKGAKLFIAGSLRANGTLTDSITFSSDRLERIYYDEPGQWQGLHFLRTSYDNLMNYATVKNALVGIRVDSLSINTNPKLLLANSIIKNHEVAGVLGYTATITGINNLIYNCGQFLLIGLYGGDYKFYQNTFANFNYSFPRKSPSVYLSNNLEDKGNLNKALNATFTNNIIYGSLNRELEVNQIGNSQFSLNFQNNLIKTDQMSSWGLSNLFNTDPLFINSRKEEYKLEKTSLAIVKGQNLTSNIYYSNYLIKDLGGKTRIFPSTLGCFE
ncbi:MAG: hypothetical protein KKG25_00245 [Bacteroidetes bacterium]|nr:hypothetical protein [Bacteroidota bacterium]MBU1483268.1 hypothetical protein [Bacteroidota bacterium]MBU2268849.1 hypothetical protein [Bacteroidota bacterium]MBU2377190.1 hypothetical protein [Bacteroidota bacterium]